MNDAASNRPIPIIYEDNHLLVVEKPVNVPTQEDESGDPDLLTLLKQDIRKRYNKPGNVFLGLVHRLDRPVGGVIVFAKTSKAASRLSESVRARTFKKHYYAVVHGKPETREARLIDYLWKDAGHNTVHVVSKQKEGAKEAVLDYVWKGQVDGLSLLQIELHTGRPHQIRVQLANIRCPLFGDQKYGARFNKPGQQIALWSAQIAFAHPTTKQWMTFRSSPPHTYPWHLWSREVYV